MSVSSSTDIVDDNGGTNEKISLIALLASSLLIAGCGGADTASRGNATVTVTEQTQLSELENAIIQAEAAMASGDARSAVTLLESHTGDAKAAELYNTAKQEALRAQLCGSWTMTEEPSLEGSYITITYNENGYTAVFGHASDNYLGYKTGEVKWKDITLGENGTLAFTDIIKTLSGVVEEQSISVAFDMDTTQIIYEYDLPERSYCYVDEPLVYTKITDEQAQQLSQQYSEKLNITYTGVPIMRDYKYDSTHYLYEAHCRMSNCYYRNYNNGTAGNIRSYATQIS